MSGTVYLVGAGPGDPGLLTLRGAELLATADAVVYDALVSERVLALAQGERIYAGKRGGQQSPLGQDEINALLVELARRHARVVRLKGGDPFVFGRGGEEAAALNAAGIACEVVPGVTAGVAGPAYAGIPVTHRGVSTAVALVTGHEDPAKGAPSMDWTALAAFPGTLVFYMSVSRMEENFARLLSAGRAGDTPAAVVERGTLPGQRTLSGTLATLPALARAAGIGAPAVVVVGEVVRLRDDLAWYDRRPLSGRRVVVTRARSQASGFAAALEELGAEVLQLPAIRIEPPADAAALAAALASPAQYDWVVFTSANAVERCFLQLGSEGRDARAFAAARVCAIGPATAAALAERGIRADLVPGEALAEAVVRELAAAAGPTAQRVLFVRGEQARRALPDGLRALGHAVVEAVAYRTARDGSGAGEVRRRLERDEIDLVTFTAASTARSFAELVGTEIGRARVASIGPLTSAAAREQGLPVHLEAAEHSVPGLLRAIRDAFAEAGA